MGDLAYKNHADGSPLRHMDMSPVANEASVVQGDKYRISVLTEGIIRLEYAYDGKFEDRASTFAIHRRQDKPDFKVVDTDGRLEILTRRTHLIYDKRPFSTVGLSVQAALGAAKYTGWALPWRYGEKNQPNHGGTARTLDEADGRIPLEPGVLAGPGITMIDDSTSMLFTDDDWIAPRQPRAGTPDRLDIYIFCFDRDYRGAMDDFYLISGKQPLIPRWALENWWSRYYAYTTDEYVKLMDRFRSEDIPFSVAVLDMNWHLETTVPREYGTGWTGYTWDKSLIKDPPALTKALHDRHLKVTANDHPADGVRAFEEQYKVMAEATGVDPETKAPVIFDVTNKKFVDAFFDILHRTLEDRDGIDFWWLDWQQGPYSKIEGIDPLWVLNHFDYLSNARKGRPMTFSRFGGPGAHRYPVGFSGDSVISWESLAFQPEFTATASNIGYGYWSNDIGGHMQGSKDDELATRWVQLGVFSPINRLHSTLSQFNRKEPWTFNRDACAAMTKALRLRHRLVPYIYCLNVAAALKNQPLVVPMYWDHPGEPEAYWHKNQYYFGKQLIVAPITTPASKQTLLGSVKLYLPPGTFVDLFGGQVYTGGRELWLHREYDAIPVLAPAGSIIPLDGDLAPANGCANPSHIEIILVVGQDCNFDIEEDDGTGLADTVNLVRTAVDWKQKKRRLTIMQKPDLMKSRKWTIRVKTYDCKAVSVKVGRDSVDSKLSKDGQDSVIELGEIQAGLAIEVTLNLRDDTEAVLASFDINEKCRGMLEMAQMNDELKQRIIKVVDGDKSNLVKLGQLAGMEMPRDVRDILLEYYLADTRPV